MAETNTNSSLKRLRNHYKLVIMNDDTFEEVIKFRLSRLSVYMAFSTIFLVMIGLAIALLVLTPLKYYIPGYGNSINRVELQALKMRTDSLEQAILYKDQYLNDLKKILGTDMPAQLDTTTLKVSKPDITND